MECALVSIKITNQDSAEASKFGGETTALGTDPEGAGKYFTDLLIAQLGKLGQEKRFKVLFDW